MNNVIELTEEQKDAFFEVVRNLPDNIYPTEGTQSSIERLNAGIDRKGLFAEHLKDVENKNVFLITLKTKKYGRKNTKMPQLWSKCIQS